MIALLLLSPVAANPSDMRAAPASLAKEVLAAIRPERPLEILTTSHGNRFFFRHALACACSLKTEVVCVKDLDASLKDVVAAVNVPSYCRPNAGCVPGETRAFVVCPAPRKK